MSVINFEFRNKVLEHNASLSYCYQCSTCSGGCPVALATKGEYNPRKIIEEAILGLQDKLVDIQDPNPWLCSTCQKCVEICPQKVELTEIFTLIKNRCFEKGLYPEAFLAQAQAVLSNAVAIPYSKAIISRRGQLGLPIIKVAPIEEIDALLTQTNFKQHLSKGISEKAPLKPKKSEKAASPSKKDEPQLGLTDVLYFFQPKFKDKRGV